MAPEKLEILISADNKKAIAAIKETILSLDGVEKAAGNTGKGVKKLGTDFTGVSRVIQDLPYGFNAISNNLTQLVPAAGAAGLAFSALVAGLSFAQIGLSNWTRGSKEADEAMSASTKALMAAAPGPAWAWNSPEPSTASSSTATTPRLFTQLPSAPPGAILKIAACIKPPTAVKPGRATCSPTTAAAALN